MILNDEEWYRWSDNQIAKHCKVTHPFVGKLRKEVVTVTSEENKPLNTKEQKNWSITVITPKSSAVNEELGTDSTSNEDSANDKSDDRNQKLLESADAIQSLAEENTRLRDAIATNQLPEDEIVTNKRHLDRWNCRNV